MTPTPEQAFIIDKVRTTTGNIIVKSLAGTGKTTTIEMMVAASKKDKPILCIAFNKRIAEEMGKRLPSNCDCRTINSLGHKIWGRTIPGGITVDPKKTANILKGIIAELKGSDLQDTRDAWSEIIQIVGMAKNIGYIPNGKYPQARRYSTQADLIARCEERPDPFILSIVDDVLHASIQLSYKGKIDFDDQIYMSALFANTFPRFPLVLVDEAQDLSPTNHAMLGKLCRERTGFVGDPNQSIYAFRGAVQSGMRKLRDEFSCEELPLSTSFRCPEEIVKAVWWRVPEFRWIKRGGLHAQLRNMRPENFVEGSAIICRNNAPLLRAAFRFISAGRSVSIAGSDIGPRIVRVLRKMGDDNITREELKHRIDDWLTRKLERTNNEASTRDMAACLQVFADYGENLGQAIGYADYIFKQEGALRLTTGHKAKGLEWEVVYHLDPWLCSDEEQDQNLKYVITTRAMRECYEIDSRDIKW